MYALYVHSNGRTMKEFIERLVQYGINVDSADRNITAYPNPFNFKIIFNGSGQNVQPVIQKKFKDIKYLKLETLTIPNNYTIAKTILTLTPDATLIQTYLNTNYNILSTNSSFCIISIFVGALYFKKHNFSN
jgi:hypothetical protein